MSKKISSITSRWSSDTTFRKLIENSYEVILVADKEGTIIYVTPSVQRVLGYTPDELLGSSTLTLFPDDLIEEERAKFTALRNRPGETVKTINRVKHKNGNTLIMDSTVTNMLHDPDIEGFIANFHDATDEQKIAETQNRLAAIVEYSDDAIISKTLDGIITSWNKAATKLFGWTAKEAIGQHIFLLIPPELRDEETVIISTLKANRHVDHFETQRMTKSGKRIYVSLTISPIKDKAGNIIGASKIARNITERREFEEAIFNHQERLRLAVEAGKIGIWDWDILNNEIVWTEQVYDIHGIPKSKRVGDIKNYSQSVHPDDNDRVQQSISDAINGIKEYHEEFRILLPDGTHKWIETKAHVFRDEFGKAIRMLGATTDINHRKHLEQQKDEFIGIASHELKTPVTSIKAYTQVLEKRFLKEGNEQSAALLSKMDFQLDKLTTLISDLLDVTKLETGKMVFDEEKFSFNDLVKEITEEMQPTTEKHKLQLKLGKDHTVLGDRGRIGQVLTNFISNAIKYSPLSEEIVITTFDDRNSAAVSVRDFGIGIPEDNLAKVFDRFYRVVAPSAKTFPGMGLGLFICSEIIKRQHGRIWVESQLDKGSTFTFSLPVVK